MDKNTVLGMVLMALVLFGFMYCNRPEPTEQADPETEARAAAEKQKNQAIADSAAVNSLIKTEFINTVTAAVKNSEGHLVANGVDLTVATVDSTDVVKGTIAGYSADAVFNPADTTLTFKNRLDAYNALAGAIERGTTYGTFAKFLKPDAPAQSFTVHTENMDITFDPRGGRMSQVVLNKYANEYAKDHDKVRLLTPDKSYYAFRFKTTGSQEVSTRDMVFEPEVSDDSLTVTMKLNVAADSWMAITYVIDPEKYLVKMDLTQHNMQQVVQRNSTGMSFDWNVDLERNEKGRTFEERNSAIYYKLKEESPDDLEAYEAETKNVTGEVKWVAFKNQFFSSVIIPRGTYFNGAELSSRPYERESSEGTKFLKNMDMSAHFDYRPDTEGQVIGFDFYLGPNDYTALGDLSDELAGDDGESLELNKLVPLGWGIFGWINRFLVIPIFNFLGSFIGSYGIIILILTIIIKIILFPFTYKSYMSQARMRVLAPEIKEINEKYPGSENAMKRQQETMKLYSRAGASPFSGCLPMLLQLPVLIALFSFFPSAIELRGQSFLWVHDLSAPDYICTLPFAIPFYGDKVSLFCLLMTATNIIYTRISMASNPGAGMGGMKWMTYFMPILFLFFFNDYAAGLSYYYFISLLITIIQTYVCRKVVSEDKVRAQMMENAKKPRKKRGLMARLEAAQKRQEALMREQAKQRAKRRH